VFQFLNLLILAHFSKFKMSPITYTHSPRHLVASREDIFSTGNLYNEKI
jgi:hypothetical protein